MDSTSESKVVDVKVTAAIITIIASLLAITLGVNMEVPLYGLYANTAGADTGMLTIVFSAYVVGLLPTLIFFGGVSDVFGCKRVLIFALILSVISNILIIVQPNMHMLFVVRILQGISVALSLGTCTAYITEFADWSSKAAIINGLTVSIGLGSGALITSIALYVGHSIVPTSYYIVLFIALISTLFALFLPETVVKKNINTGFARLPYFTAEMMLPCMGVFAAWSVNGIFISMVPLIVADYGYNNWAGLIVFLSISTGALVQPMSWRHTPQWSLRVGYILSFLSIVLLLIGVSIKSLPLVMIATTMAGASGFGFIYLGGLFTVVESAGEHKARAVSGYSLFAYLGLGLPSVIAGYASESIGFSSSILIFGSVAGIVFIWQYAVLKKQWDWGIKDDI
ncbi:MAG: MFS family permease [Arenicella sp.]|jgi:MFS family permease